MFHIKVIKDGNATAVQKETLVDGQMFVDDSPRQGSTNTVTSGGVAKRINDSVGNSVEDLANSDNTDHEISIENPEQEYEEGKFYYFEGTFNLCTAYSESEATFNAYSICEALNYLNGLINTSEGD